MKMDIQFKAMVFVGCLYLPLLSVRAQEDASSRMFRNLDKDKDGKLSVDEFPEKFKPRFKSLDSNGDGYVDLEEHRAQRRKMEEVRKKAEEQADRIFKARDKDGDGRLSKEELPEQAAKMFSRIDRDGDGAVSKQEYVRFQAQSMQKRAAMKAMEKAMQPSTAPTRRDVSYGEHEKQRFDIWTAGTAEKKSPLVIYIHGGGFSGGDKNRVNGPLIEKLLKKGIAFASMNYRLTDVGPYPMQMHDCARGLQTIRQRAAEFHIDPERIGLMGGSAGSGISQWLAFHDDLADPKSEDPILRQSTRVRCAVPYAAQCSYDPRFIADLFDTDRINDAFYAFYDLKSKEDVKNPKYFSMFEDASPITHLSAGDPPIFLYYSQPNEPLPKNSSGKQHIHHPKFGIHLKKKMDELGLECTLRLREDSPGFPNDEVTEFFVKHLSK